MNIGAIRHPIQLAWIGEKDGELKRRYLSDA